MACLDCRNWIVRDSVEYGDGTVIVLRESPVDKGQCGKLGIETPAEFSCAAWVEGDEHDNRTFKVGSPWNHFVMIPCPECEGGPRCGGSCRCAGTGNVRKYDDGYIGEEKTRLHPKEKELGLAAAPKCQGCGITVETTWLHCPQCGHRLMPMARTEVITGFGNSGEVVNMAEVRQQQQADVKETLRQEIDEQNKVQANP